MKYRKYTLLGILSLLLLLGRAHAIDLGIDTLAKNHFNLLDGKRVGLVTNETGVNRSGKSTRLILKKHSNLVALYTTGNGLDAKDALGQHREPYQDGLTNVTTYPLIGKNSKPTAAMLAGIDVLVFDIQDTGCRSFPYLGLLANCMQAAAQQHKEFIILDRPDPLGGNRVEGMTTESHLGGSFPIPYVYGMTVGELALMANAKGWLGSRVNLQVVPMSGWSRDKVWQSTGLHWVPTAPYLANATSCFYYAITSALAELRSTVNVGLGTSDAYRIYVASWVDSKMISYLREKCHGIDISSLSGSDKKGIILKVDPKKSDIDLSAASLYLLYEGYWASHGTVLKLASSEELHNFYALYGTFQICEQLDKQSPEQIIANWQPAITRFRAARMPYLMYH